MDPESTSVENMVIEFESRRQASFVHNNEQQPPQDENTNAPTDNKTEEQRHSRNETQAVMNNTATELEAILNDVKTTTKRLLEEITTYTQVFESVSADYMRCQSSQRKEAQRLEEVSPDVEGATNRFLEQQLAMVGGSVAAQGGAGGIDLAAMLSGHGVN